MPDALQPFKHSTDQVIGLLLDLPDGWQLPQPYQSMTRPVTVTRHDEFWYQAYQKHTFEAVADIWLNEGTDHLIDRDSLRLARNVQETKRALRLRPPTLEALLAAPGGDMLVLAYDKRYRALVLSYPPDA
jgi:hypothetical protein